MPRRRRHFVMCKKGLHLMSGHNIGIDRLTKPQVFQRGTYVRRYCIACRRAAAKKTNAAWREAHPSPRKRLKTKAKKVLTKSDTQSTL